ncbi:Uncharacterized protein APZ42_026614 [Daphnia magna]|uniref:Uncharacterized protein n=1 Tax=Daphnia magna TaxID=35525 RepID=A0A164S3Z2_9CRUS|nr:Uncharacterized protein APZ42_026614 [Daphnia magna]
MATTKPEGPPFDFLVSPVIFVQLATIRLFSRSAKGVSILKQNKNLMTERSCHPTVWNGDGQQNGGSSSTAILNNQ